MIFYIVAYVTLIIIAIFFKDLMKSILLFPLPAVGRAIVSLPFSIISFHTYDKYIHTTYSVNWDGAEMRTKKGVYSVSWKEGFCITKFVALDGPTVASEKASKTTCYEKDPKNYIPYILLWKPGAKIPFPEEVKGEYLLFLMPRIRKCRGVVLPYNEEICALLHAYTSVGQIPDHPRCAFVPPTSWNGTEIPSE